MAVVVLALLIHFAPLGVVSTPGGPPTPGANQTQYNVTVRAVDYAPNSCLANASAPGYTGHGGDRFPSQVELTNPTSNTCEVVDVSSLTNGFTVVQSNAPVVVPAHSSGGVSVVVQAPRFDVNQAIVLEVTVQKL